MAAERVRVLYSGRVQGVGFRFTAVAVARGLAVSGFVRNLGDGRVEMVAEGERAALETLLAGVRGRMAAGIGGEEASWLAPSGEFSGFRVSRG